jgi:tellurite resistance protein
MNMTAAQAGHARSSLDYLPVGLFGSVLGLTGLSVACRLALTGHAAPAWSPAIAPTLAMVAITASLMLGAAYTFKALTAFEAVRAQLRSRAQPGLVANLIAWALLALATLVITGLLARTVLGIARGERRTLTTT